MKNQLPGPQAKYNRVFAAALPPPPALPILFFNGQQEDPETNVPAVSATRIKLKERYELERD